MSNMRMPLVLKQTVHVWRQSYCTSSQLVNSGTYLRTVRTVQRLKEDDEACLSSHEEGKYLVFSGSQPLLQSAQKSDTWSHQLVWLEHSEVRGLCSDVTSSSVLLDVDKDGHARFGLQIGKLSAEAKSLTEKQKQAVFTDLRVALFTVTWRCVHVLSRANSLLMFNRNNAFCGRCGGATHRNVSGSCRKCPRCSHIVYPASNPVGIVLVSNPDKSHVVLVRQARHPPGMFTCIAGFADVGESLEETVKREVAEEVGLVVDQVDYVASQHWPFPGSLMAGCYATSPQLELSVDLKELEGACWFSKKEVEAAVRRIHDNPMLRMTGTSSGQLIIPPPWTIANLLIVHWVRGTPLGQIYSFLK